MDELGKLFRKAREFGRVRIYTTSNGLYHCTIEFNSIAHTSLEAKSGFDCVTPEIAVVDAIQTAESIVSSIMQTPIFNKQLEQNQ